MKVISGQMKNLKTWKPTNGLDRVGRHVVIGQIQHLHNLWNKIQK